MQILKYSFFSMMLLLLFSANVLASADADLEQGISLFKSGKYTQAVEKFESAKAQGLNTIALNYNLASSYFKLERYADAREHFQLVAKSPEMHDLAMYNIGLISLKLNDVTGAQQIFTRIITNNTDPKLVSLSRSKLNTIQSTDKVWRIYSSLDYGHDSNITSLPSETSLDISDNFYNLFLSVNRVIAGKRKDGWLADASYFRLDFSDSNDFDEFQYAAGISKEQKLALWNTRLRLGFSQNNFAGDNYQSAYKLEAKGSRALSNRQRIYLRYRYEDINSDQAIYDYLAGWRQQARIEYRQFNPQRHYSIYYELELNDRNELVTSSYAYDYSPTRQTIRGRYTFIPAAQWNLITDVSFKLSDFPSSVSFNRDDEQLRASIGLDYLFSKTLRLKSKLEHVSNRSSVDIYDYEKTRIMLGLSKLF